VTIASSQVSSGMVLSLDGKIYRVESITKVNLPKGVPFIKAKLKCLASEEVCEKNFKPDQLVEEVMVSERNLEYLYPEGGGHLFLDIDYLEHVSVSKEIVGDKIHYLKEGIQVKAILYGTQVFSIELPPFLELMVVKIEESDSQFSISDTDRTATLETGGVVKVPLFIAMGDVIKVDTQNGEFIQRI